MPRSVGMSMRSNRPYGSNEASIGVDASAEFAFFSSAKAILAIHLLYMGEGANVGETRRRSLDERRKSR
jgi:hypothetical protein